MKAYRCGCGEWRGEPCPWRGPLGEMTVVEYMPVYHRSSHEAARNSGVWPRNGAQRVAVCLDCAEMLEADEGDPETWPDGCTWVQRVDADPADYADAEGES